MLFFGVPYVFVVWGISNFSKKHFGAGRFPKISTKNLPTCVSKLGRCLDPHQKENLKLILNVYETNPQKWCKHHFYQTNIGEPPLFFWGGGWLNFSITKCHLWNPYPMVRGEGSTEGSVVLEGTDGSPHLLPAEHLAELGWFLGQQKLIGGWMKSMDGLMDFCTIIVAIWLWIPFFCAVF